MALLKDEALRRAQLRAGRQAESRRQRGVARAPEQQDRRADLAQARPAVKHRPRERTESASNARAASARAGAASGAARRPSSSAATRRPSGVGGDGLSRPKSRGPSQRSSRSGCRRKKTRPAPVIAGPSPMASISTRRRTGKRPRSASSSATSPPSECPQRASPDARPAATSPARHTSIGSTKAASAALGARATARGERRRRRLAEARQVDGDERVAHRERPPARKPDRRRVPAPVEQNDGVAALARRVAAAQQTKRARCRGRSQPPRFRRPQTARRRRALSSAEAPPPRRPRSRRIGGAGRRRCSRSRGQRARAAHAARPGNGDLYCAASIGSPKPV